MTYAIINRHDDQFLGPNAQIIEVHDGGFSSQVNPLRTPWYYVITSQRRLGGRGEGEGEGERKMEEKKQVSCHNTDMYEKIYWFINFLTVA